LQVLPWGPETPVEAPECGLEEQFRSRNQSKIFFSILAKRLTTYLISNGYIDTSCQKAGVPGFPGCVEHSAAIWEQIQRAKRER